MCSDGSIVILTRYLYPYKSITYSIVPTTWTRYRNNAFYKIRALLAGDANAAVARRVRLSHVALVWETIKVIYTFTPNTTEDSFFHRPDDLLSEGKNIPKVQPFITINYSDHYYYWLGSAHKYLPRGPLAGRHGSFFWSLIFVLKMSSVPILEQKN